MSDTANNKAEDRSNEEIQKSVAYYSSLVNAWVQSRMQRDRSLLALSSGGIGLLVTIGTASGIENIVEGALYSAAFLSFLAAIASCLTIFHRNAQHLENIILENEAGSAPTDTTEPLLRRLDWAAMLGFGFGVLFGLLTVIPANLQVYSGGNQNGQQQEQPANHK